MAPRFGAIAAVGALAVAAVLALGSEDAHAASNAAPPPQQSGAPPGAPNVKKAQQEAQQYLSSLGYVAGNGKPLAIDGKVGPLTCGAARFIASYFSDQALSADLLAIANSCSGGTPPVKAGAGPAPAPKPAATIAELSSQLDDLLNSQVATCSGIADQISQLVEAGGEPTDAQWQSYNDQCAGGQA